MYRSAKDVPIEDLNLSVRSFNGLRRAGIVNVQDLILTPREQLYRIRNLGIKSIDEIVQKVETIKDLFETEEIKEDIKCEIGVETSATVAKNYFYIGNTKYVDIPLEDLNLSVRAYNCLKSSGIQYYSELLNKSDQDLLSIRNMGLKTVKEIVTLKSLVRLEEFNNEPQPINEEPPKDITQEAIDIISDIGDLLDCNIIKMISSVREKYKHNTNNTFNLNELDYSNTIVLIQKIIFEIENSRNKWINRVFDLVANEIFGLGELELYDKLPDLLKNKEIFDCILNELITTKRIDLLYDDRFVAVYEGFETGAIKYLKDKEYEVLIHRIKNKTLEEIGQMYDVSRERIRQIEAKAIRRLYSHKARFKEDIYLYFCDKYFLSKEDFKVAFGECETFNYLALRYGVSVNKHPYSKKQLSEILDDRLVPVHFKKAFSRVVYKNYVKIGKDRVLGTKQGISNYILKNYAVDDLRFEEFQDLYYMILKDLNKLEDESLGRLDRGYENKLIQSRNVLWKFGRKFRYYNIESYNFDELLDTLDLNQYLNVEYSTLKFYRSYPELMINYDIRDEYELHNLLKKICNPNKYPNIKFNRMPNIEFGIANRDEQVQDLLYLLAPISKKDFADEYEMQYGVLAATVLANYVSCIEKYFYNGFYNVDFPTFSELIRERLRQILVEDIYTLSTVKQIYISEFPASDINVLNPLSLKMLGFKVYGNYILKNKYNTASEYFYQLLTKEDVTDIEKISPRLREIMVFSMQLYKLKEEYDLIEFMPNKFINFRKLKEFGLSKEAFREYCDDVLSFIGEGKYFTVYSIKNEGFMHSLDELGFEDWFYTSLLIENKERISYKRIGGNKILFSGKYNFNFEDFLENIVYSQKSMSIEIFDLYDILRSSFNINIEINRLIYIINSTSMHYDRVTEQVYADYDTYYEVI